MAEVLATSPCNNNIRQAQGQQGVAGSSCIGNQQRTRWFTAKILKVVVFLDQELSSMLMKGRKSSRRRRLQLSQSLQQRQMRRKAAEAATDTMEVATVAAESEADGQKATMVAAKAAQEARKR
jgi:hypothetical protein